MSLNQTIWIFGANGFIGKSLFESLSPRHRVTGFTTKQEATIQANRIFLYPPTFQISYLKSLMILVHQMLYILFPDLHLFIHFLSIHSTRTERPSICYFLF